MRERDGEPLLRVGREWSRRWHQYGAPYEQYRRRLIEHSMIERLQANPDVLRFHVPTRWRARPSCSPERLKAAATFDPPSRNETTAGLNAPSVEAPLGAGMTLVPMMPQLRILTRWR